MTIKWLYKGSFGGDGTVCTLIMVMRMQMYALKFLERFIKKLTFLNFYFFILEIKRLKN